jgi:hypothetical protein
MQKAKDTKVLHEVKWLGVRTTTFNIIGHQMLNWEWNFTKQSNWGTNVIEHHFVICTVKYTHLCIMHGVQTSITYLIYKFTTSIRPFVHLTWQFCGLIHHQNRPLHFLWQNWSFSGRLPIPGFFFFLPALSYMSKGHGVPRVKRLINRHV